MALTVTAPDDCGVNVTLQLPEFSEQLAEVGVTEPPDAVTLTAPPGVLGVPGDASVTVTLQVED